MNSYILVSEENIKEFTTDKLIQNFIFDKIWAGQKIVVSNHAIGEYICSCTIGIYSCFQRIK